jgi:CRISPR-associated protein Csb2
MAIALSFTIRFLSPEPAFHGRSDGAEPEWPPSPLRLFQALVDAAASRLRGREFAESAKPALEWLQRLSTPMVIAPPYLVGTPFRIAVPNNDLDVWARPVSKGNEPKKQPNELKTMKTIQPVRLRVEKNLSGALYYIYSLPSDGCMHLSTLKTAARSITHLGWGVDMVAGDADVISDEDAERLSGERWRPVGDAGANGLRVPVDGTLQALLDKHRAFLDRLGPDGFKPVPPLSAFRVVGYRRTTDPPARPWTAFRLRHPMEDRAAAFCQTAANRVAAMTRNCTARVAAEQGQPGEWIDRHVHGHRGEGDESLPRFSYLPLPSIERRGQGSRVVGAIRRVLVAELASAAESHLQWARQMLPGGFLNDEDTGDRTAMLTPLTAGDWVLRQYTAPTDSWSTVTPVVLPGSDEGKLAKAEKLFVKALRHAGYSADALANLEFRNVSFWPGGCLALQFQRPLYLKKGHWSVYHMRLRWRQPITGPIAIGAGRHCGLGTFAAAE